MGSSGHNIYNQFERRHKISDILLGDASDFVVGTARAATSVFLASNDIGWAIGAGFAGRFVYQATHQDTTQ